MSIEALGQRWRPPRMAGEVFFGFCYWAAFLLILEPGNAMHAARAGVPLSVDQEIIRIIGASLLGSASTPLLVVLVRRLPVRGKSAFRNLAVLAGACCTMTLALLLISYAIAPIVLAPDNPRLQIPLGDQIASNELLVAFAMATLALLLHIVPQPKARSAAVAPPPRPSQISVQARNGTHLIDIPEIDWIESQENYVALHVGVDTFLVRETLTRFAERLDGQFLRIHRRTIVNVSRLRELTPLPNGDALVQLTSGAELRASRTFGQRVREHFRGS